MDENQNSQFQSGGQMQLAPVKSVIAKMAGDMNFLGIISIIYGALACLSIIGALFGVPMIIAGIRMRESSDGFKGYLQSDDVGELFAALERQSRFFNIYKILTIVYIVIAVLYIIGWVIFISIVGFGFFENLQNF